MDSESKYITDQRGVNIRLDEKHIKLLAAHKIIE